MLKVLQNRESLPLAEPNTKRWELQWRKTDYFIMDGATQENRKLMFKNSRVQGEFLRV